MSNGFDITAFIPKFVDENRDRIQKLNQAILTFEKNASNLELLKEIMREVHTLKGTARMMGFADIVTLSHKIEDVFVRVKEGNVKPVKGLYDVVFEALDTLEKMVEGKLKDTKVSINTDEVCNRLEAIFSEPATQEIKIKPSQPVSLFIEGKSGIVPSHGVSISHESIKEGENLSSTSFQKERLQESTLLEGSSFSVNTPTVLPLRKEAKGELKEVKKTIRIGLDKVDVLSNHVVELIMAQMTFHQRHEDMIKLNHHAKQLRFIKTEIDDDVYLQVSNDKRLREIITRYNKIEKYLLEELSRHSATYELDIVRLDAITEGIRQQVMSMRMQPVSHVFDLAARLVRDLSRQFNKDANLVISGVEVELDNTIIEMLKDPLMHLLRNAMDHGIEEPDVRVSQGKKKTGTISLRAKQEGGDVLIIVEDDGRGIDRKLIKETAVRKGLLSAERAKGLSDEGIFGLIMVSGFTTSKIVTDTSGRGVGMDVVKTVVDRLHGSLVIESIEGQGSRFIVKVPATIALINVLLVRVGNMTFAIPSTSIERIAYIFWNDVKSLEGKSSIFIEGQTVPLVSIADIFLMEKGEKKKEAAIPIIISRYEGKKIGFMVGELFFEKEVVSREFRGYLKRPRYFSGVTTLGTGEVVLILNIQELIQRKDSGSALPIGGVTKTVTPKVKKNLVLIAEDSMITAELEKNILINAGYEVDVAIDGIDALDKLHFKKYHVLVTDIDMPRMNGFELTSKVKTDKRLKDIPVIIVTSKERVEDKRRGIEVGADAYILKKEFDQSNLLNTVKRLIGE